MFEIRNPSGDIIALTDNRKNIVAAFRDFSDMHNACFGHTIQYILISKMLFAICVFDLNLRKVSGFSG